MRMNNMDESYKHNSEQKKSGIQEDFCIFHLHKVIYVLEIMIAIVIGGSFRC